MTSVSLGIPETSNVLPELSAAFDVLKRELCMGSPIEVP